MGGGGGGRSSFLTGSSNKLGQKQRVSDWCWLLDSHTARLCISQKDNNVSFDVHKGHTKTCSSNLQSC